jgi:hypothetical protein
MRTQVTWFDRRSAVHLGQSGEFDIAVKTTIGGFVGSQLSRGTIPDRDQSPRLPVVVPVKTLVPELNGDSTP